MIYSLLGEMNVAELSGYTWAVGSDWTAGLALL